MLQLIALFFLFMVAPVRAADGPLSAVPEQPDIPPPIESGEPMEPDITIIRKGEAAIEEQRMNNRVVRVRVTPAIGPSYYLEDPDGDGNLEVRQSDNERGLQINRWVLFRW